MRNIFYDDGSETSVTELQARGTTFWQCNVALALAQERGFSYMKP